MDNKEAIGILKSFIGGEIIEDGDKVIIYEKDLKAIDMAIEALENQELEKERIVGKLIDAYTEAYIKSKIIDTPRETLIRWDGHKEGISEAIDIVKGGLKNDKRRSC